ncbi:MAG: hypothetical protein R3C08_06420 [Hyphomonas sp.]
MSLFHPPPDLPPHLIPIWPLIWVQAMMLRAYVRATWGKGTEYYWGVTPHGRALIVSIVGKAERAEMPDWAKPPAHSNARIAAALDGSLLTPRLRPQSPHRRSPRRRPGSSAAGTAVRGSGSRLAPG